MKSLTVTRGRVRVSVLSVSITIGALIALSSVADEWDDAEKRIQSVEPSTFRELPQGVIDDLQRQGCKIPQAYGPARPHNVIRGSFAAKDQQDWAALCSRGGVSEILIFWGGPARCVSGFEKTQDRVWLQGMGQDGIVYSQAIRPVNREEILSYYEAYGGPKPPPIDHQGINHLFPGKASVVHYCYEGKWIELTGAD